VTFTFHLGESVVVNGQEKDILAHVRIFRQ